MTTMDPSQQDSIINNSRQQQAMLHGKEQTNNKGRASIQLKNKHDDNIRDITIEIPTDKTNEQANNNTKRNHANRKITNKETIIMRLRGGDKTINNKESTEERITTTDIGEEVPRQPNRKAITTSNIPYGHICDDVAIYDNTPYVRVYCQNVCGMYDRGGIGLDAAFQEIKQAGADIFAFNETHGDESNSTARRVLRLSKQQMWRDNNEDCKIVHSSSTAPILTFTKPGGNLVGITGALVGRIRETITDPYGRWCGFTMIGKDNREILILTAYNVSQYKNAKVGEDTLFNQQIALYKLNKIREPDPKKIFIEDLKTLIK
jgi:hypothetical protein